jgi:hypothetical protein
MGGSSSIRFAGACNPNATAPVIAQGLYATNFSNFIKCNHNSGYISFNLSMGDNIGLICNIISCCKYLGQFSECAGIDRPSRRCTEAATSTFVNFHATILRDICNFGIECSIGDVLTYLFHVLNFQEFVQRHVFYNNYIVYSNEDIVTIDLQCFKYFDTVFSIYKFNVCFEFSDTLLHCTVDQLAHWHSNCLHAVLHSYVGAHVRDMLDNLPPPPLSPGCPDVPVYNFGGLAHLNNKQFSVCYPYICHICGFVFINIHYIAYDVASNIACNPSNPGL